MGEVRNKLNHSHENCNCGEGNSKKHEHAKAVNNNHEHDNCGCGHDHGDVGKTKESESHENCGCESTGDSDDEGDPKQKEDNCGCGIDHGHSHEEDQCGCGEDHGHNHKEDQCGCGEDHGHKHEEDQCGCGEDHGHKHGEDQCGCGEDHGHEHKDDDCGCGVDHGHGEKDEHGHVHKGGESCSLESHSHSAPKKKDLSDNGNQFRLALEGLDCAGCAGKIEERTNKLDKIAEANLNFTTKTLVVNLKNKEDKVQTINEIKAIVKKLEPDVIVKEKKKTEKNSPNKMKLTFEGLDCAGCAGKIEERVNKLADVREANLNFTSKFISIEVNDPSKKDEIEVEVKAIVKKLEPDVVVNRVEEQKKGYKEVKETDTKKKIRFDEVPRNKVIKFIIAIIIYGIGQWGGFGEGIIISLFVIAYLLLAYPVLTKAVKNITKGEIFDENFLMSIATIGAFATGEHPEAVAVMLFYEIGEMFQGYALNKSRNSITELMDIKPDYARIEINGEERKVAPESVNLGDVIIVRAGERIPLDGVILSGTGSVDTSALTGESMPRDIKSGDEVLGGCINLNGVIKLKVTTEFEESTLSKILELVENAGNKKAPTEKFVTRFSRYYTPVVVFTALALFIIPPLVIPGATFTEWLQRALIFLVVSCPCALVVSIPLGFFGGIGLASKEGILVKGGNYLEALNTVKAVVFDKTGTLTEGKFNVTKVESNKLNKDEFIKLAAHSEYFSNHPIAESIKNAYSGTVDKEKIEDYSEIAGKGVSLSLEGKKILAGNTKLMKDNNILFKEVAEIGTAIHFAMDNEYIGHILIGDRVKESSKETIAMLKKQGIKTVMLTGDNRKVADAIGAELGLDIVCSELLPQNKVEELEKVMSGLGEKENVVFVGDGINDAPVLARADIGIAMGGVGSDAAIEAADVVIMNDEPQKIIESIDIAKKTRRIVWQNIIFALGIKAIILIAGALGYATMWEAVFGDVGVAIIAILNSMRILMSSKKEEKKPINPNYGNHLAKNKPIEAKM